MSGMYLLLSSQLFCNTWIVSSYTNPLKRELKDTPKETSMIMPVIRKAVPLIGGETLSFTPIMDYNRSSHSGAIAPCRSGRQTQARVGCQLPSQKPPIGRAPNHAPLLLTDEELVRTFVMQRRKMVHLKVAIRLDRIRNNLEQQEVCR